MYYPSLSALFSCFGTFRTSFLAGFARKTGLNPEQSYSLGCLRFIPSMCRIINLLVKNDRVRRPCVGVGRGVDRCITDDLWRINEILSVKHGISPMV